MVAKDIMQTSLVTASEKDSAARIVDLFQAKHIHSAPVVDGEGRLVGMVSQEDILIGSMSLANRPVDVDAKDAGLGTTLVGEIMTSPAIHAVEDMSVRDLCRMMWRFRIHHVPIVRSPGDLRLVGIVSSIDICRVISEGHDPDD